MIRKFLNWIFGKKISDKMNEIAEIAIGVVDQIKSIVDSPEADVLVAITKTPVDNIGLEMARYVLSRYRIIPDLYRAENPTSAMSIIVEFLRSHNKDQKAIYYTDIAAKIMEAYADGKITRHEAIAITQMTYQKLKEAKMKKYQP